jgi:hypothetical protein
VNPEAPGSRAGSIFRSRTRRKSTGFLQLRGFGTAETAPPRPDADSVRVLEKPLGFHGRGGLSRQAPGGSMTRDPL